MEWLQIVSLFFANAGLILWMRQESRSDWRHLDVKCETHLKAIQHEMRDFHEKLIKLEERSKWSACNAEKNYQQETNFTAPDDVNASFKVENRPRKNK